MFDALLAPALAPFTVAIGLMLLIALAEAMGMMFGVSPSGLVDQLLPEADADFHVDADGHTGNVGESPGGWLSSILGWLCVGKVPLLVLLVALLTTFGLAGFILQAAARSLTGWHLPAVLAAPVAFFAALPPTRWLALGLARVMPKEETDAVSSLTFIGKVATITRGIARSGVPAEAKLRDSHGQIHYILVEPDDPAQSFEQGAEVLLTSQSSAIRFKAIRNDNAFLSSHS